MAKVPAVQREERFPSIGVAVSADKSVLLGYHHLALAGGGASCNHGISPKELASRPISHAYGCYNQIIWKFKLRKTS